jgi:hypothetical protein
MNEITRFDLDMDGSMEPSEHGLWVRYEDAQRQWVGLTDEEMDNFVKAVWGRGVTAADFIRAIEAKLKEKNNG